jgi:hypothetical protein
MGMRDEHSLLHIDCMGLDTNWGNRTITQNKGKQRHACVLLRLFICRTYEAGNRTSFFPMSFMVGWGGVGWEWLAFDLGFWQCDAGF